MYHLARSALRARGRSLPRTARRFQSTNSQSIPSGTAIGLIISGSILGSVGVYVAQKGKPTKGQAVQQSTKQSFPSSSTSPLDQLQVPEYGSKEDQEKAFAEITAIVGKDQIVRDKEQLDNHSDTVWSTHHAKDHERPGVVVYPSSTEEVSKIMKVAHKYRVPVTAFSGGTSLEGHFTPSFGGISLDFQRMDQVLAIHKDDLDAVVQPAVGWEALNEVLDDYDLFFAPDPGPGAQIGGMIGTSCSGTNAARYGTMKENVVNLTVVLADGTVIKTRQRPRKSSAGYNLTGLFVGSEGTLGIVTEATVKLVPKPKNETVSVVGFTSVRDAADVVSEIVQHGINVAAVELLDEKALESINKAKSTSRTWEETPTLFFKFNGTKRSVEDQIDTVRRIASTHGSVSFDFAQNKEEADELWSARKHALWSTIESAPEGSNVWTTDVAVPVSQLPEVVAQTKKDIVQSGLEGSTIVGHVGDGNFHAILAYNPETQKEIVEGVVHRMVKRALEVEGTCTGEHGVGEGKKPYLEHELSVEAVDAMRRLKKAFDPLSILNPDKVVTVNPRIDSNH
uniref:D-lactate dehydrogenase (cytochrome) n=1 Tax=Blastobotrys adeninivorans TaxID=409370 RepID=A0A060T5Z6_BLAAD